MRARHLVVTVAIAAIASLLVACGDNRSPDVDATACTPTDDGNDCTDDVCLAGQPAHVDLAPGTACATGVCDGDGACVGCLEDDDCTGLQICDEGNRTCVDPTCDDEEQDGTETDVDCGGMCLPGAPCADGLHCNVAADCASGVCEGTVCQVPRCGDGVQHAGEVCDDGNDTNGDGCDDGDGDTCRITGCGNGVVTVPEVCDDGNNANGDGCDNNCTPTGCGNGITTGTELCDDENTADGDGCTASCVVEAGYTCTLAPSVCVTTCGDGIRAGTEACDDAPPAEGNDGCSATCTVETGWTCTGAAPTTCATTCGDGIPAGAEVCDDGNNTNGDGCDDGVGGNCRPTGCGNGVISGTEACDDGNTINGDGCDNNCTPSGCGNGVIAGAETCDQGSGNVTPGDGCSATCRTELGWTCTGATSTCVTTCGDGIPAGTEQCDDVPPTENGDGCSATCTTEPGYSCAGAPSVCSASCGDGIRAGAEQCDDAPPAESGDGCSATCTTEAGWTCTGTAPTTCATTCGDGIRAGTETCDDGGTTAGDGCSATCAPETGWTCTGGGPGSCVTTCGDGIVAGAEACDQGNLTPGDGCSATCTTEAGWTCTGTAPSTCTTTCGDGIRAGAEACDDGGTAAGDGCSATCTTEAGWTCTGTAPSTCATTCGDGVIAGAETCDQGSGNVTPGDGCSATCTTELGWTCTGATSTCTAICGDGRVVMGEACDDGNTAVGDGCSAACAVEPGYTCVGQPSNCSAGCGDGIVAGLEECDDGDTVSGNGCSATCTTELGWSCVGAGPGSCTTSCGDGIRAGAEQCDDAPPAESGDGCSVTCTTEAGWTCTGTAPTTCATTCGDGVIAGAETCDQGGGNVTSGDGCSATCTTEPGWTCTGATSTCATTCGDGIIAGAETCDQGSGNVTPGDGCSATCATEIGWTCTGATSTCVTTCGDGFLAGTEQCDDGGTVAGDGCSATCTLECGNGTLGANEQCDDGARVNGDGCSATCTFEVSCAAGETLLQVRSTDVPKTIPDSNSTGVSSNAVVPAGTLGAVRKVSIGIGSLPHTYVGDLALSVASPTTKRRSLMLNRGAEGDNLVRTRFEDTAATSITTVTAASAPFTGVFRPEQTLSDVAGYLGENAVGTWSLRAIDSASGDTGTITNWTLSLCVNPAASCGNGVVDLGEECDTSGASATCTATCQLIDGCGDGNLDAGESCDDDNTVSGDGCSSLCQADIACAAGETPVVVTNATSAAITDDNVFNNFPVVVPTAGAVTKAIVTIGDITHANTAHLDLQLQSPLATVRNLTDDNGSGANYRGTQLDDAATTAVTAGTSPFSGRFRPEATITTTAGTDFRNQNALGTWNLQVRDDTTGVAGTFNRWSLALCLNTTTFCGNGVTEAGEECDTAGPSATCSGTCRLVDGCGDGNLDAGETCDDDGFVSGDGCSSTCQLEFTCAAGEIPVTGANGASFAIPDGNTTGISSPISLAVPGAVTKVVAVINNITHGANVDVDMFLIGPSSINRELSTDQSGANYISTYFDDAATTAITGGSSPYTGRFRPETTISTTAGTDFRGQNGAGTWTLNVIDDASVTVGTLNGWSIALCVNPTAAYCGDGIVQATEECDTSGASATCSASCQLLDGCGDGNLDTGEFCDDNNIASGDGCSATCQPDITCAAGQTPVVLFNSTSVAIPDNVTTGVSSPIAVTTAGAVKKVQVTVGSLTHANTQHVDLALISPLTTTRNVSDDNNTSTVGANYRGTVFADAATTLVTATAQVNPYTGLFRPEATLSTTAGTDFLNQNALGTWNLRAVDDTTGTTGTLDSWALALCLDTVTFCGNGVVDAGEECDTAGPTAFCGATCLVADGCGDGNLDAGELCDDNNVTSGDGCSATCQPDITCAAGETPVILSNTTAVAIPDTNTGTLSLINQPTAGLVRKVIPTINITHPATGDLDIYLVSPVGPQRILSDDNGSAANYAATTFSDAAATGITSGTAPFTGTFRSEETLSDSSGFGGVSGQGTWSLKVGDDTTANTGTINRWTLALCIDTTVTSVCGNGFVEAAETCDDGNTTAGDGCSASCQVELSCPVGQLPVLVTSTSAPAVIPDGDTVTGVTSPITIAASGTVRSVVVVLHQIPHTFGADLDIYLASPLGTQRSLSLDTSGANFFSTMLSDAATGALTSTAGHRGRFRPTQTISGASPAAGFAGEASTGTWNLRTFDDGAIAVGLQGRWTLGLCVE